MKLPPPALVVRNRANKNAAENGDGAKYSLRSYSEQQLRNWENSKRIVVYSSEAQLREFIKDARAGRIGGRKMYFGMVPQNLAQKIMSETGINVDGYNCSLSRHMRFKRFSKTTATPPLSACGVSALLPRTM